MTTGDDLTMAGDTPARTTGDSPHHNANPATIRRGGLAGIAAGLLFPLGIVVITALEWRYMHDQWGWRLTRETMAAYPSGLSTGPLGSLQIANFALTGLLVLVFGRGLMSALRPGASRTVAGVGLVVMGLALVASAFPTDFVYRPTSDYSPTTWHGWIHDVAFYVLMVGVLVATTAFAVNARRNAAWRGWALPTLIVPVTMVLSLFGVLPAPFGFDALVVVWFGWIALVGYRLSRPAPDSG